MRNLRHYLQHRFNPLHVFCRLRNVGMAKTVAIKMCSAYERFLYNKVCL